MYRIWDRSKPPRGPFTFNRDTWQAQGLLCWYPMGPESRGVVYDRAGKNHFTTVTGVGSTLTDAGSPALVFANGSSSILQSSVVPVYSPPITVACWARKDTASDTVGTGLSAFGDYTLGFGGGARRFQFDTHAGDLRWISVGASAASASKSGIVSGRWHHMMGVELSTTSRYAVLDGIGGTQNTTSATPGGTQNRFVVGAIFDDGLNQSHFSGQIGEFCVWNRSLFDLRGALADPGQRFALWYPLRSRKWFSAPAAGVSISVGVGAADAAGAQAAVVLTTTVAGNVGAADAAGAQAAVALSTPVVASVGAADAAGAQATVVLSTTIAASVGAASADGAQAAVQTGAAIAASIGAAAASGAAASVVLGTSVAAATGNAAAAGVTATVLQTTVVAATEGAAAAGGATAQVVVSTSIQASVGNAVAAGVTAAIPTATTVPAAVGAATADGALATIDAGRVTIAASVGAGAAAGASASVAAVTSILASIGAATASGAQATVAEQIIVPGLVGAAAAAGAQATVLAGLRLDIGVAQATAAGWLADIVGAGFTPKGTLAEAIVVARDDNAVIVPYEDRTVYVR